MNKAILPAKKINFAGMGRNLFIGKPLLATVHQFNFLQGGSAFRHTRMKTLIFETFRFYLSILSYLQ
jgi:hypothetical protein